MVVWTLVRLRMRAVHPEERSDLFFMMTLNLILCGILLLLTVAAFLYKRWLENRDDPYIHLHNDSHDSAIITTQTSMAKRLDVIDKVKNGLLVATIIYILAIIGMTIYTAWNSTGVS